MAAETGGGGEGEDGHLAPESSSRRREVEFLSSKPTRATLFSEQRLHSASSSCLEQLDAATQFFAGGGGGRIRVHPFRTNIVATADEARTATLRSPETARNAHETRVGIRIRVLRYAVDADRTTPDRGVVRSSCVSTVRELSSTARRDPPHFINEGTDSPVRMASTSVDSSSSSARSFLHWRQDDAGSFRRDNGEGAPAVPLPAGFLVSKRQPAGHAGGRRNRQPSSSRAEAVTTRQSERARPVRDGASTRSSLALLSGRRKSSSDAGAEGSGGEKASAPRKEGNRN
ncbi:hypothetical protein MTO96_020981 [Rhipicephalus appendiculatus]